ncbi:MAG TPA: methionyl-tRNA formyltransferase [Longimicrobiales bacterium]|nr:methionyl-tRNA formyltransferase [Longimicrobiales bacterium]
MRILFWGTPTFAVPSLRALDDEGYEVVGVVTQPDRPAGRGRHLAASPVKQVALDMGVPVLSPEKPRGDDFLSEFRALAPDLSVVVAYGHILRPEVLDVPPLGSINVHASLLPALRGAAPINWAIVRGYEETGVTIMRMVEGMDAGPVIHTIPEPILPGETASELTIRLSELGAEGLVEALAMMAAGRAPETEQDHAAATFAPKVDRATARVDWSRPATELAWHVRGMDAVPGAWTELDGAPVKIYRPEATEGAADAEPGTVVAADDANGLVVATGAGRLVVGEVQPPGRRRMEVQDWIHGRSVQAGQRFV